MPGVKNTLKAPLKEYGVLFLPVVNRILPLAPHFSRMVNSTCPKNRPFSSFQSTNPEPLTASTSMEMPRPLGNLNFGDILKEPGLKLESKTLHLIPSPISGKVITMPSKSTTKVVNRLAMRLPFSPPISKLILLNLTNFKSISLLMGILTYNPPSMLNPSLRE